MAMIEELGRMAMVDIGDDVPLLPQHPPESYGWGRLALLLAASAAFCGLLASVRRSGDKESAG